MTRAVDTLQLVPETLMDSIIFPITNQVRLCAYECKIVGYNKKFINHHSFNSHKCFDDHNEHKCSYCDYTTKCKQSLVDHTRIHTGERPYKCNYEGCNKDFILLRTLKRHIKVIHYKDNEPSSGSINTHYCMYDQCSLGFSTLHDLYCHESTHTINCQAIGCYLIFTCNRDYKEHLKTHTSDTTYHCNYIGCLAVFNDQPLLALHIKGHQ